MYRQTNVVLALAEFRGHNYPVNTINDKEITPI